jgi:hypothetical protein
MWCDNVCLVYQPFPLCYSGDVVSAVSTLCSRSIGLSTKILRDLRVCYAS